MEADSLVGSQFAGRFHIQSLLGEGGAGAVYLARHTVLDRLFAIKVIQKSRITDVDVAARFRREARAASRVQHPGVTAVVDFGHTDEGQPYLVMEHVEGETLAAVIKREPQMQLARAIRILSQIADALAAAHRCQVIHRDLKPQNVVLTNHRGRPDVVKVLDFGLAKILGVRSTYVTRRGEVVGSYDYMSPEQCRSIEADHRTDIYSFGALAYRVLAGEPVFSGVVLQKVGAHMNRPPPVPSSKRPDLPASLDALVLCCLAKQPGERFQSAAELKRALQQVSDELGAQDNTNTAADAAEPSAAIPITPREHQPSIDEVACSLRDRGLGSARISTVLAQKIAAEDRLLSIASEIAMLESNLAEVESSARQRRARLQQALAQLEHEKSALASGVDTSTTAVLGSRAMTGGAQVPVVQLEQNVVDIAQALRTMGEQAEQRVSDLQQRIAGQQQALAAVRAAADKHRAELERLVEQAQRQQREREDEDPTVI